MIFRIAVVIGAGLAGAGLITWAVYWYARSEVSADPKVRRRSRIADALVSLGVATLLAVSGATVKERKFALITIGSIIAAWLLLLGAKLLLTRGRS